MEQKTSTRAAWWARIPLIVLLCLAATSAQAVTAVMQAWSGSDGPFNTVSLDGNTLYQGADGGGGTYAGFMYFRRPGGVSFPTGATLYLEVDYKDLGGPGRLGCQYNAVASAFQAAGMVLNGSVQNSGGYKTAVMRLDSADLRLAQNGGNDLRLTRTQNLRFYIKEVRVSDAPGAAYLALTAFMGPYTGPAYAGADKVDSTSLLGKMVVGYQGWFRTPMDDDDFGWAHWTRSWGSMATGLISEDYWPQMDEFSAAEKHIATGYNYPSGAQAELFSSDNARTVLRHFQWMEAYGIDGAGVQRFTNGLGSPSSDGYRVLSHVRAAANQTGRTYFVEYDMTGTPEDQLVANIANDWHTLVDTMKLTGDERYLKHNGLPVAGVFGFFPDRFSTATANAILDIFQAPGPYQAFVAGAGGWWWRIGSDWTGPWKSVVYRMGSWQPWNCGNYMGTMPAIYAKTDYWAADKADLDAHGVIYVPELYPGASSDNRDGLPPGPGFPRQGGDFLWKQFTEAYNMGMQSTFLGMFDELDEGTQILKVTDNVPTQGVFKTYEGQPSDCYLCYAGLGSKMLKHQMAYTATRPNCPALTQPSIPDPISPLNGATLDPGGPWVTYSYTAALALPGGGSIGAYEILLDGYALSAAAFNQALATAPGTHVWRVRAINTLGNPGGWSLPQTFTVLGPTPTPSFTRTPSATPSRTPTATASRTATSSATPTATASRTPTSSATPSVTASSTSSRSPTFSPSGTPTPSPAATATASSSRTPSSSPSASSTGTLTASMSATASPLASGTATPTCTVSPTPSMSATASPLASATATTSATASLSPSASPTATRSASASPSATATASATATITATPSRSGTATPTRSVSASSTASTSPTLSATWSPTFTPQPSASPTPTALAPGGACKIVEAVAWPDPDPRRLSVRLEGKADSLRLKIYSVSWQMLQAVEAGPTGPGWSQLELPPEFLTHAANGAYYFRINANGEKSGGVFGKFCIVR